MTAWRGGMEREVGGRFTREGTYVYLRLVHVDVWQKPTQYYKVIILKFKMQKKRNSFKTVPLKKKNS